MPDFEELQRKKERVINTSINTQSKKLFATGAVPENAVKLSDGGGQQDALRKKYVNILTHDFTGQKWITKEKKDRRARSNINDNYKLVIGTKKNLTDTQQQLRKSEFEGKRKLSYLASNELVDFVEERDKQVKEWTDADRNAAAKELLDVSVEDFDFDSDETFLKSFKKNMHILARADRLEKALLTGIKPEGFDKETMRELSIKLSDMRRIREAYEDRIQIISSPYYVSLRTEDLTLPSIERLNKIAKGLISVDETLKSFAVAVTGWRNRGSKLFSMGKVGNGEFLTDTIAENIILKNGIDKVNNCFNSIDPEEVKKGNTKKSKKDFSREKLIRDWIYGDLKLLGKLNRKQLSDKIALYITMLEKTGKDLKGRERTKDQAKELSRSEKAIEHVKRVKNAFDEGRYSKESVIIWLDRYLMSDNGLCRVIYNGVEAQKEHRDEKKKKADQKLYLDEISGEIDRFINSVDGLEAHFQNQKDPLEQRKIASGQKSKNTKLQKVYFVGKRDEKADSRHGETSGHKTIPTDKGTVRDHMDAGYEDFLHIYGENASAEVLTRTYVSVKPSSKGRSVKALVDTAIGMGMQKELYFKISTTAEESRVDDIVIYFGKNLKPDQVTAFLDEYKRSCEENKVEFAEGMEGVVVGRDYSNGLSLAPEPTIIGTLNSHVGNKKELVYNSAILDEFRDPDKISPAFSFTGLMVDLLYKSAVLAAREMRKGAQDKIDMGDPKTLELTKKYLRELSELNGIDTINVVDDDVVGIFKKKEKAPGPKMIAEKAKKKEKPEAQAKELEEEKKEQRKEIRQKKEIRERKALLLGILDSDKTDPLDDLDIALEGGDAVFAKFFKEAYHRTLNAELRDVARRQVTESKQKAGIKNYKPDEEEIAANMPAGTIVINDDRVAEFLLQYKQGIEAGTDSRELDRFRAQFQEDMKKQGAKFPPVLNAKLYAMSEAVREATRYAENRKALIEEGNAAAQDIKDVEYNGEDLKDEKQIHSVSCWACSGTMNANNYIARHKDTVDKGFEMTQEHFLNEDNLILNSGAKEFAMQDKYTLNRIKMDLAAAKDMTDGNTAMGNIFTMADVYLRNMSDTAVRRTQFKISNGNPLLEDPEAKVAIKSGMLKKIADMLIMSGGPISMFIPGHYITVTGVKNGVILYHDSRAEKKADPEEKKKNPGAKEDELKRAKLDATFEMTSEELLENCVNGSVELFTLVHLDEESIAGIKNEFKIGAEGQVVYDMEGKLEPALDVKDENKSADTERMFHNLGVEFDRPLKDGGALSKLEFMQDTIYLPKLRDHKENVERNLPKKDLLENVGPEDTVFEKEKRLKEQEDKGKEENKRKEENKQKEEKHRKEEKNREEKQKEEKKEENKERNKEEKKEEGSEQDFGEKRAEKTDPLLRNVDVSLHSADFVQMYTRAMQLTNQGRKWRMKHGPDNETLGSEYRTGSFKERISKKEREKNIKNPKSRLWQKAQNAAFLKETVKDFEIASYDAVNRALTRQAFRIDKEEYQDLSAFMLKDNDSANFELAALYLGKSVKMQREGLEGQDVLKALDLMAQQLFLVDVESLKLNNDTELVKNAEKLEKISAQVSAFDRLMKKHGYLNTMKPENQERLNVRLNALRSVAAYYQVRKEIITDETYKTHYNDELSMNKTAAVTDAQKSLAEKLLDSLVLGRTMMRLNGTEVGKEVFGGDRLDFKNAVMNTRYAKVRREYSGSLKLRSITGEAFAAKDARSQKELERLQKRLKELNAVDPIAEQKNIQKHMEAVRNKAVVPVQGAEESMTPLKKLKNRFMFGWRWFSAVPIQTVMGVFGLTLPARGSEKDGVQKKRDHKMVPGREGEEFRDEIVRKDEEGEDIDVYSDVRRGPLVWEKLTAGDPEDPPEVCIMMNQAKRGDDAALTGKSDMGHAMIGLTYSRYNKMTKRKERYQLRMGFWPGNGLSPFAPVSLVNGAVMGGRLQDDDDHEYDVALRYQVKPGDINKILRASEKYADRGYTGFKRNCTTFVIDMAKTINLPIVKELKQQKLSFGGVGGALVHMARGANHPGITAIVGNHMASKMNKMDLSYQNFGQKMYTKEELDRFYKTSQYDDDQPFGYAPGPVGEQMRSAKTGELSAYYEEDKNLEVITIKKTLRSLGASIAEAIEKEIPEEERTEEDGYICGTALQIEDFGLDDLLKSGEYTSSDLREAHKEIRNAARSVSGYYKSRLKSRASFNADVMRFLSLCEVLLSVIDQKYRDVIRKEVKGDAGSFRYDFANTKKEFTFIDAKNVKHKIRIEPGVLEGYLLAGKTVDEAVRDIQRREELSAREKAAEKKNENEDENEEGEKNENGDRNAEAPVRKLNKEEKKELHRLRLTYGLADDFASANRYLLEKDSFDEKDVRYAFKELPEMEKGSGILNATDNTRFECMPSATYKAVIFESLLGGLKELSLDRISEARGKYEALDKYLTESFKAKPELAEMILKYFAEAEGTENSVADLTYNFVNMFAFTCLVPPYRGTDFSSNDADFCVIRLSGSESAFNAYLTEQFGRIKKNSA